jgi:hypothetical protein
MWSNEPGSLSGSGYDGSAGSLKKRSYTFRLIESLSIYAAVSFLKLPAEISGISDDPFSH